MRNSIIMARVSRAIMSWAMRGAAVFLIGLAHAVPVDLAIEARRAKEAMLAHRYAEAATIYRRMAAEVPDEPGIRFNLALALHSMGRYWESTEILERLRSVAEKSPSFWFLLGEGYLNLDEPQKAVEPLSRATELNPSDLNANAELASALLESGQFAKSSGLFQALSSQHPELPKVWAGLSLSERGLAHPELANQALAKLEALPESAERSELLARVYASAGRQTDAIAQLSTAQKQDPHNPRVESALAKALLANRDFDQAAVILRSLLASNPDNPGYQFDLGDLLLQTGHAAEALPHLRRAVELSPALLPAQAKLGEVLLLTGSPAAAVTHLERAESIDVDGSVHFQLATAYRRLGKPDLAAKAMARRREIQDRAQERSKPNHDLVNP